MKLAAFWSTLPSILALCLYLASQPVSGEFLTAEEATRPAENLLESLNHQYSRPSSRIVNGERVQPGERPFQIALYRRGRFICGGSLIGRRFALTAAHCVDQATAEQLEVHYGSLQYKTGPSVRVDRIWAHPGYTTVGVQDDIAVLRLASRLNATQGTRGQSRQEAVAFVEINNSRDNLKSDEPVTVSGWGRTARNQTVSEDLLRTTLKIVDFETCAKKWSSAIRLTRGMICAADVDSSACHGDSGGPLTLATPDSTLLQVGVVSIGAPTCYSDKLPNVYTHVYHYRDWIRRIIRRG